MWDSIIDYVRDLDWVGAWRPFGLIMFAGFLGAVVGLEREMKQKPAGLRTHFFVAASAALLMLLGHIIIDQYSDRTASGTLAPDPTRILHAIVLGISFLGAGTIIKQGEQIEGLTTSSSVLLVTGIGIAVAVEQFVLASLLSVSAVVVLVLLGWVERRFSKRKRSNER